MPVRSSLNATIAGLPLRFEANAGQWDESIRYVARTGPSAVYLTDEGATWMFRSPSSASTILEMKVAGGRLVTPTASDELVTKSNYFVGNDPSRWRTDVRNFGRATYRNVRDGVDLVFHGDGSQLEYDFIVAPGTSPNDVAMEIEGAEGLSLAPSGSLIIHTVAGDLEEPPPHIYQVLADGGREVVSGTYRLQGTRLAFDVGPYDRDRALVIDPIVALYSTYLGGSGEDEAYGVALDGSGSAYIAGQATGTFPTKNPLQGALGGVFDAFVAKLNPAGSALVYATYLGGSAEESAFGIAVDSGGNAYVVGSTASANFPTQGTLQGYAGNTDAFVAKLNAAGSALVYSTYVGGALDERPRAVCVDSTGNLYAVGETTSANFPTVAAQQASYAGTTDAFVFKLNSSGSAFVYSTFLGGNSGDYGLGIASDGAGNAYAIGSTYSPNFPTKNPLKGSLGGAEDAFITKLDAAGATVFSTYFGGSSSDAGTAIALGGSGKLFVTGITSSADFPVQNAYQSSIASIPDAYVASLNATGSAILYSTFLGGAGDDYATTIAADANDNAFVAGWTGANDFPTSNAFQTSKSGLDAGFVARFSASGSVWWSTYLGGNVYSHPRGIVTDGNRNAYVAGGTSSTDFPTKTPIQGVKSGGFDAFVTKLGWPALVIGPSFPTVPPKSSKTFIASGGSGVGYTYALSVNASGATINPSTGVYVAGSTPSVTDTVLVTDSDTDTVSTPVFVGPGVSVLPANPTPPPKGTIGFSATGGSGVGWVWSLTSNNSGATINASSGVYTAGATPSVTDTVHVSDSLGNVANVNVSVGPGVSISPASPAVPPKGAVAFTATGGNAFGWKWTVTTNNSGATIGLTSGAYVAGAVGNVVDKVQVTDSLGNAATVNVSVGGGLAINPAGPSTPTKGSIAFTAIGGSGVAYAWSLSTNASGGTINVASGQYVAGSTGGVTDSVTVVDSLANAATVSVTVGPTLTVTPSSATVLPGDSVAFSASGGSGNAYAWAFLSNASAGSLDPNTGAYVAGTTASVTDSIQVADSLGNTATASIKVKSTIADAGVGDGSVIEPDAGTTVDAGAGGPPSSEGCGCTVPGEMRGSGGYAMLVAIVVFVGVRARRRPTSTAPRRPTSGDPRSTANGSRTARRSSRAAISG